MIDIQNGTLALQERNTTTNPEERKAILIETSKSALIPGLDGEVKRQPEMVFPRGMTCDFWMGTWDKVGGGGMNEGRVNSEKVSLSLTTSILLTRLVLGGLESTPNTQVVTVEVP
jgi:hypothetical protein